MLGYLVYIGVCPSFYTLLGSEMSAFVTLLLAANGRCSGCVVYCLFEWGGVGRRLGFDRACLLGDGNDFLDGALSRGKVMRGQVCGALSAIYHRKRRDAGIFQGF
jgi:hypothetical protein